MKKRTIKLLSLSILLGIMTSPILTTAEESTMAATALLSESETRTEESTTNLDTNSTEEITTESKKELPVTPSHRVKKDTQLKPHQYSSITLLEAVTYDTLEDVLSDNKSNITNDYLNKIIRLDKTITLDNNETYYHFSTAQQLEGYVSEKYVVSSHVKKYVTVSKQNQSVIYSDLDLTQTIDMTGHTFLAKEAITVNKEIYLSLFDSNDQLIGFTKRGHLKEQDNKQGSYHSFDSYITFNQLDKPIYQNFTFKSRRKTTSFLGQTFIAKGGYYHFDGNHYLSIFDNKDKWQGYISETDVATSKNKQGNYQLYNKYVSVTKQNYPVWQKFNWKKKADGSSYTNQTYHAKGVYHHFNGQRYLSLYNGKEEWQGYINEKATSLVSGPQGAYQSYGKYVTVTHKNYQLWGNFNWKQKANSNEHLNRTYKARGLYKHINGSRYLSLYDNSGNWLGYLNENATKLASGPQGIYQNHGKYVTVTQNNYSIWHNFDWKKKNTTNTYKNKTVFAKGRYIHANGSTYLSLFDSKGTWLGYVNQSATTQADGAQGIYHHYGKNVTISSANYPVWRGFDWKTKNTSHSFKGKDVNARGIYHHFNGASYFSLYEHNGSWLGYINTNSVQQYDMSKLIPNQDSLLAVHHVVQQKILDTSANSNRIMDEVLNMPIVSRNHITFTGDSFTVKLPSKKLGMTSVDLSYKEIAPAVNYKLLPADKIKGVIPKLNNKKKYVALTFDDGPNPRTTPQLLNTLKRKNVKATFFMLGNSVNANPSVARKVRNDGHQVASHSYSHPQLTTLSSHQITREIQNTDKAIYNATGVLPKEFRPPYGAINQHVAYTAKKPAIMWSVDTRDWESRNANAINTVVNNYVHNGAIILLHDIHQPSVDSVPQMIDNLRRKGYEFVTVDELLALQQRPLNQYSSQYSHRRF